MRFNYKDVKKALRPITAWWVVIFLDPIAIPVTLWMANNISRIKPNHVTIMSLVFSLLSSVCFLKGSRMFVILGAILFEISFFLDCIDGKLARLTSLSGDFGAKLDYLIGRSYTFVNLFSLILGQYFFSGRIDILLMGSIYIILNIIILSISGIIQSMKKITILHGSEVSAEQLKFRNSSLSFLLNKYCLLKGKLEHYRLPVLLSEIDALNLSLFVFPLINRIILGIYLALIIRLIELIQLFLIFFGTKEK